MSVNYSEINRLKKEKGEKASTLFGNRIEITDFFWYRHGLNEIFVDESYKFSTDKRNPIIIDCGANIGLSVIYFKKQYPESQVIAFEADPHIANTLQKNLNVFGYNDVEIIAKAVWTENAILSFASDGGVGGQIVDMLPEENLSRINKIEATRLKDYLKQEIDFLKIDVEGAEYDILKDCKDELKKVNNLFIEYHSFLNKEQTLDEILLIIKEAGFKYYIKEAWNNMPNPYIDSRRSHYDLQLNIFAYRL